MTAAWPLAMTVGADRHPDVHLGPRPRAATASYSVGESPEAPPYAWNGQLYLRQAGRPAGAVARLPVARAAR